ncbi:MAG TPA: hypothetical protein VFU02_08445 [Polyangiaceae bacterium]|nr:hypothetical protein [Polyangiaceae bacterium]
MRRYIATLHDVSIDPPLQGFPLPSSGLVPCLQDVAFGFVALDHEYVARVQGYDRDDLSQQITGSPNAVDSEGRVVAPRWTAECGQLASGTAGAGGAPDSSEEATNGEGGDDGDTAAPGFAVAGVTATANFTVYTSYWVPFVDHGPPSDTGVSVRLDEARRELDCGDESGEIAEFTAELAGATTAPLRGDCESTVQFTELAPAADYRINVLAFEAGADEPRWQTTCRATALGGTVTPASCDPLSER